MKDTTSEQRKAYRNSITTNNSLEDIFSDRRKERWDSFSIADKKKLMESKLFIAFAKASGLAINFDDHENPDDPFPDIRTTTNGDVYYFELGEATDQGLKWAESASAKTGEITSCAFSQLDPLLKMFRKKCATSYQTDGAPVDLVLYFSTQPPYEPQLYEDLIKYAGEVTRLVRYSQFVRVWLYSDRRPHKVLWKMNR